MKPNRLLLLLLMPGLILAGSQFNALPDPTTGARTSDSGFAVVELFTSEGCSSCPPADRLLAQMIAQSSARDTQLYAMAFHVDYWDDGGWRDPYSHHDFTARQVGYTRAFGPGRVYTPQMIVNGATEFVGSNPMQAGRAIALALRTKTSGRLLLRVHRVSGRRVQVHYHIQDMPDDTVVHLAVVEKNLTQKVRHGENAGRTLKHDNVVRAFATLQGEEGDTQIGLPAGLILSNSTVIGFAQDPISLRIIGAGRIDLATYQGERPAGDRGS